MKIKIVSVITCIIILIGGYSVIGNENTRYHFFNKDKIITYQPYNEEISCVPDFFTYIHISLVLNEDFYGNLESYWFGIIFDCNPDNLGFLTIKDPDGNIIGEFEKDDIYGPREDNLYDAYTELMSAPKAGKYTIIATNNNDSESITVEPKPLVIESDIPTETPVITYPSPNEIVSPNATITWESYPCDSYYVSTSNETINWHTDLPGNATSLLIPQLLAGTYSFYLAGYKWREDIQSSGSRNVIFQIPTGIELNISRPNDGYLYVFDKEIISMFFGNTIIIGKIAVNVEAHDNESGIERVEFFINDLLKVTDEEEPYTWVWNEKNFGKYIIKAVAYDDIGNSESDEITVWKFF